MRASHVLAFAAVLCVLPLAAAGPASEIALHLTDSAGRPLAVASSLSLTAIADPGRRFHAEAPSGGVTRYILAVPPGVRGGGGGARAQDAAGADHRAGGARRRPLAGAPGPGGGGRSARPARESALLPARRGPARRLGTRPEAEGADAAPRPSPPRRPACQWTSLGPRNINGRVRALAAHPTRGKTLYAGAANAGVWITRDSGTTWSPLMRDEGSLAVGSLAVHLTDPAAPDGDVTVYAGTGQVEFAEPRSSPPTRAWRPALHPGWPAWDLDREWRLRHPGRHVARCRLDVGHRRSRQGHPLRRGLGRDLCLADGGKTWNRLTAEINVQSLALDPADAKTLWAGVTGTGILKIDTLTGGTSTLNNGLALTTGG